MNVPDKKWWAAASRARDKLEQLIGNNPAVSMIDIGRDEAGQSDTPVLRVHVRSGFAGAGVPDDVDGIPVRVIPGDYQLE